MGCGTASLAPFDQTHAAAFWQTNPGANYNAIARRFVDQFSLDVSDSARLFALLDLSAADALINAWNDKYYWNFWRPITAIHKADIDGNAATVQDRLGSRCSIPRSPIRRSSASDRRRC